MPDITDQAIRIVLKIEYEEPDGEFTASNSVAAGWSGPDHDEPCNNSDMSDFEALGTATSTANKEQGTTQVINGEIGATSSGDVEAPSHEEGSITLIEQKHKKSEIPEDFKFRNTEQNAERRYTNGDTRKDEPKKAQSNGDRSDAATVAGEEPREEIVGSSNEKIGGEGSDDQLRADEPSNLESDDEESDDGSGLGIGALDLTSCDEERNNDGSGDDDSVNEGSGDEDPTNEDSDKDSDAEELKDESSSDEDVSHNDSADEEEEGSRDEASNEDSSTIQEEESSEEDSDNEDSNIEDSNDEDSDNEESSNKESSDEESNGEDFSAHDSINDEESNDEDPSSDDSSSSGSTPEDESQIEANSSEA